jgi:alanine racemase
VLQLLNLTLRTLPGKMTPASDFKPIDNIIAADAPLPASATGLLTIDLDAIVANWRKLSSQAIPADCAAVVKADAYGCGITQVTRTLAKAGCRTFFVATLDEARAAREVTPTSAIYVLDGFFRALATSTQVRLPPCDRRLHRAG